MFAKVHRGISGVLLFFAGLSILAMMIHIASDVMARQIFNSPIEGTLEFVANYYMVGCVMLAMAAMQREGGQVVVEIFLQRLSERQLRPFDAFARLLTIAYVAFLVVAGADEALEATKQGAFLSLLTFDLPIWQSRWLVPLGFAGMIVVLLLARRRVNSTTNE